MQLHQGLSFPRGVQRHGRKWITNRIEDLNDPLLICMFAPVGQAKEIKAKEGVPQGNIESKREKKFL